MLVNEQILTEYFLKWRDLYFGYKLTLPKFKFTNNFKYVARFECNVDSNNDISDETIFFSRQYDYTDHDLDNLMVHEMIHYYLCKIKVDMKCSHDQCFLNMAKLINEKFHLNVSAYVYGLKFRPDYSRIRWFFSFLEPLL